ncbi:MAG: hypothetical protein L3J10_06810 [Sulfurimonas sp.]|nr:hypothetical protein [Sulfurimonas sp.]
MNKKSNLVLLSFISLLILLCIEGIYIYSTKTITDKMLNTKLLFVKLSGMPDLAILTDTKYIRHRSLSDVFSIYSDDGVLREYKSSSFVYFHSTIKSNNEF